MRYMNISWHYICAELVVLTVEVKIGYSAIGWSTGDACCGQSKLSGADFCILAVDYLRRISQKVYWLWFHLPIIFQNSSR